MTNIYDLQERRDTIELNKHLDSQYMSDAEEVAYENRVESALCDLVDDALLDITSDELIEALIECKDEWYDFITNVPCNDQAYSLNEAAIAGVVCNTSVQRLIDALEQKLRKSLRCVAEEEAK